MNKHSKRYQALKEKVDRAKIYSLDEAIELLKEGSAVKFDAGVELHIRTGVDPKQSDQQVRGAVSLPAGSGRQQTIAVLTANPSAALANGAAFAGGDEFINQLKDGGKLDFDVLLAEPEFMPKLASSAKILGPRGLMPSPKSGTVTNDISKTIKELRGGKINFKSDNTGNIHLSVGRSSFSATQLKENIATALNTIKAARPASIKGTFIKNITVCTVMGPGIKIAV